MKPAQFLMLFNVVFLLGVLVKKNLNRKLKFQLIMGKDGSFLHASQILGLVKKKVKMLNTLFLPTKNTIKTFEMINKLHPSHYTNHVCGSAGRVVGSFCIYFVYIGRVASLLILINLTIEYVSLNNQFFFEAQNHI